MSLLKPSESVLGAAAVAAFVVSTYQFALPTLAESRTSEPADPDLAGSERTATWVAAAAVTGVSLLAKDPTIFTVGALTIVTMAWLHRHANMLDPMSGQLAQWAPHDDTYSPGDDDVQYADGVAG